MVTGSFFFYASNARAATQTSIWTGTTLISAWVVDTDGWIYTPVALNTDVDIAYDPTYSSNQYQVTRKDLIAYAHKGYWNNYTTAQMNIGTLTLRGSVKSLPTTGNYLYPSYYYWIGKYSSATEYYSSTSSNDNTGTSYFYVGTDGFQINNTGSVTFTW
jgi:hypothetical protein